MSSASLVNVSAPPSRSTRAPFSASTSRTHTATSGRHTIDNSVPIETCSMRCPVALGTSRSCTSTGVPRTVRKYSALPR